MTSTQGCDYTNSTENKGKTEKYGIAELVWLPFQVAVHKIERELTIWNLVDARLALHWGKIIIPNLNIIYSFESFIVKVRLKIQ